MEEDGFLRFYETLSYLNLVYIITLGIFMIQAIESFTNFVPAFYKNMTKVCPNYGGCRLVQSKVVEPDDEKREAYIETYCLKEETYKLCKRYITRKSLWICPDFVLPDTNLTEDEIIDLYEKKEKQT